MSAERTITYFSKLSVLTSLIAFQYKLNVIQQTHRRTEKPSIITHDVMINGSRLSGRLLLIHENQF